MLIKDIEIQEGDMVYIKYGKKDKEYCGFIEDTYDEQNAFFISKRKGEIFFSKEIKIEKIKEIHKLKFEDD